MTGSFFPLIKISGDFLSCFLTTGICLLQSFPSAHQSTLLEIIVSHRGILWNGCFLPPISWSFAVPKAADRFRLRACWFFWSSTLDLLESLVWPVWVQLFWLCLLSPFACTLFRLGTDRFKASCFNATAWRFPGIDHQIFITSLCNHGVPYATKRQSYLSLVCPHRRWLDCRRGSDISFDRILPF